MPNLRQGLSTARALFFVLAIVEMSHAQGQLIIFSATGDVPYGSSEVSKFQQQIINHNKYSPSAFFVHVGDIFRGGEPCDDSHYATMASMLKSLAVPVYIIPGDNETIDCITPAQAFGLWKQYFINYEQNFCGATATEHQSATVENFTFTMRGVLFIGINMVGGSSPYQQDADWVTQQLQAKSSQVRAAVIFSHIGPDKSAKFSTPFRAAAAAFGKPILFLHGHAHSWFMDNPFPETNILRVQVDNGAAEDPIEVTVTLDTSTPTTTFTFKRNPWSSKTIVNMPPCANAGPDQTLGAASNTATLQGQVIDDGDPNGGLITTWSKVSGPGTVTFGDLHALATTASFGASGTYVLRLTADDGQLQKSDDVTMVVNGSNNSSYSLSMNTVGSGTLDWNPPGNVYNSGTVVTLTATPAAGFQFSGWSGDLSGSTNPATITMNANKSMTATFTPSSNNSSTNLARGKPVTASSTYSGKPPENALDGSTTTYWRSGSVSSSNPIAWLRVDLGSAQTVGRAVVRWKENYYAKSYELQISNDDVSWATVYSTTAGASGFQQVVFSPTAARYVRFYMKKSNKSSYQIFELEVYSVAVAKRAEATVELPQLPTEVLLEQNYPNPFNPATVIAYSLPRAMQATLKIYNFIGQEVATLVEGYQESGRHEVIFNASELPSGNYFAVLQAGEEKRVRLILLMK